MSIIWRVSWNLLHKNPTVMLPPTILAAAHSLWFLVPISHREERQVGPDILLCWLNRPMHKFPEDSTVASFKIIHISDNGPLLSSRLDNPRKVTCAFTILYKGNSTTQASPQIFSPKWNKQKQRGFVINTSPPPTRKFYRICCKEKENDPRLKFLMLEAMMKKEIRKYVGNLNKQIVGNNRHV